MNCFERIRHDAHESTCEALSKLNKLERKIDADWSLRIYAPEGYAELKRDLAESRAEIMDRHKRLLAKINTAKAKTA